MTAYPDRDGTARHLLIPRSFRRVTAVALGTAAIPIPHVPRHLSLPTMKEITGRLSTALADRYQLERHLGEGGMEPQIFADERR